jgi:phenylacetate-CoA ligase
VLVGYPSVLRPLAQEQLAGRLSISPGAVMSASEVLTTGAAREMGEAWESPPWDVYAATETAGIASPCHLGRRHLYEDLVLVEPVDEEHRPVPLGTVGAFLLVTVLFSRTIPLIRYELSDRVTLSPEPCPCGMPFAVLESVEGRQEDVLELPSALGGTVPVHPNVMHVALDDLAVSAWQVVHDRSRITLLVLPSRAPLDLEAARRGLADALRAAGALVDVDAHRVDEIPRTPLGKTPLIRRLDDH